MFPPAVAFITDVRASCLGSVIPRSRRYDTWKMVILSAASCTRTNTAALTPKRCDGAHRDCHAGSNPETNPRGSGLEEVLPDHTRDAPPHRWTGEGGRRRQLRGARGRDAGSCRGERLWKDHDRELHSQGNRTDLRRGDLPRHEPGPGRYR